MIRGANEGASAVDSDFSEIEVRLRHLGELIPAKLEGNILKFKDKIKKPAAGQSAVLYRGEVCLGGGIIC